MVKVIVLSSSKCETTRLVIDPNDPNDILWVSGPEGIHNCDNVILKSCKMVLLKYKNVGNHVVMVYYNENVKTG